MEAWVSRGHTYTQVVHRRCSPPAGEWLHRTVSQLTAPLDRAAFSTAYASARRRLGDSRVTLDGEEEHVFRALGIPGPASWPLDEVGRAAFLLHAMDLLPAEEHAGFVAEVYSRGDNHERQALLRALDLMPDPARFLITALEACRTNVQTVFEAIACENPYPAWHFPEPGFSQMVLKALFLGVELGRIVGLARRTTPELERMAGDYARERRIAGRPVPPGIALILRERNDEA